MLDQGIVTTVKDRRSRAPAGGYLQPRGRHVTSLDDDVMHRMRRRYQLAPLLIYRRLTRAVFARVVCSAARYVD